MYSNIAISAKNLSKCYHIYNTPKDRLKQAISFGKKQYFQEFWALENISFEVKKGSSIGIIGRNGSGKSTLLQILCRTLTPTSGEVIINGKIAALLELGAGFNPEFTGRENVYLNGTILGLTKTEIDQRYDEIQAFADIGNFINQPVKTYSSGMFVRLAFAVQACVNPDILIVDEALSVGDVFFQQKCLQRMQQLRDQGTTLIFVSHDMSSVRDLCEQAIYLKKGKCVYFGPSGEAIIKYFADSSVNPISLAAPISPTPSMGNQDKLSANAIVKFKESACWIAQDPPSTLNKIAQIIAIAVLDSADMPTMQTPMATTLKIRVLYQSLSNQRVNVALILRNRYNHVINCNGFDTQDSKPLAIGEFAVVEFQIECMIEAGIYTFSAYLSYPAALSNQGVMVDESPSLGPITITWDYETNPAPWLGMFGIPTKARLIRMNTE